MPLTLISKTASKQCHVSSSPERKSFHSIPTGEERRTCPSHAVLMTAFSLLLQIFGSPSTPILENPEYQTRWYFKYFLGKREYFYVFYQNMNGEPMSRVPKALDERKSFGKHKNLMRRHNFILDYKSLQVERNKYVYRSLWRWLNCLQYSDNKIMFKICTIVTGCDVWFYQ
jgi:hypothetical protein